MGLRERWRCQVAKIKGSYTNGPAIFRNSRQVAINDGYFNTANTITINQANSEPAATVLDELPTNNSRNIHADNHAKRTKDTCLWFINGTEYRTWKASSGGMMWGTGMPGAGKTVLASAVIDNLEQWAKSNPDVSVSFAFCRYTQDVPVIDILLSLIRQQAERNHSVEDAIGPIFSRHKRERTHPSVDELADILKMISKKFKINVYVLDGVDEAKGDVQFKLIETLSSVGTHFLITSRPLKDLESIVSGAVFFPIAAKDYDLELMFEDRVKGTPRFRLLLESNPGLREEVLLKIKDKAGGMFLHASLQMDTLRHCVSVADLRQEMEEFPEKIEDLYIATLARVGRHPRKQQVRITKELLIWIINAQTDLIIDDLRFALSFSLEKHIFEVDGMVAEDTLVSLCLGLITVDKESKLVRLVHYTAKEVLQRLLTPEFPQPHEMLATCCIARLVWCKFQGGHNLKDDRDLEKSFKENLLLQYAYENWAFHACQCDSQSGVWETASRFVWECQSYPHGSSVSRTLDMFRGLHLIARYDLLELLSPQRLHPKGGNGLDINAPSTSSKRTPLMFASRYGHVEMVKLLLGVPGVEVNAQDDGGTTALMFASAAGQAGVVQLLLHAPDFEVNLASSRGWTALMYASSGNHDEIVQLLLDIPGIQLNCTSKGLQETALNMASERGHEAVARRLLKAPDIQVGLPNWKGKTAMNLAVEKGHEGIAKLLREYQPHSTS